ncbi:probable LRR receptor-like serine/threonine-protein kinase RFK1 isoform X2 [Euphorbia lathyris]|uniref:probable LRR receptor-like serine/threonine-protein kinase RFK1 isoform X2 n=1 Tax=Euphorbia lathyris TaxID=212925 RepID=UPI003313FD8F
MKLFAFLIIALSCFKLLRFTWGKLVQQEVDALEEITRTMGSTYWKFDADSCEVKMVGVTPVPPKNAEHSIECKCNNANDTDCHVVSIVLKGFNLPGVLPSQLFKLPYLQAIDFAFNFLNGSIPREWSSMQLTSISLLVNRLSGEIPKELGDITTLIYLGLETNQFSGIVPSELGNLINLQTLMLSSNLLTGNLPMSFGGLVNLTDLRINDNNFSGTIQNFIRNWKKLTRLEMHASGLEGPIPSSISLLNNLSELRLSDMKGPSQKFPNLSSITGITRLVLRSCNISGELPAYIWAMKNLEMLDVSFNMLVGKLPETVTAERLRFVFLTGNLLSGNVPESILRAGSNVWQLHSCAKTYECPQISSCFHVNCGGKDATIKENKTSILYRGDVTEEGGTAKLYVNDHSYWGFSSTGDFMDDNDYQNTRYTVSLQSSNISPLLSTARISPISLTYFHYCLKNGKYLVRLHFAEIQFTDDKTYNSLGRRMFDIYIQERLEKKDFNIEDVAGGVRKPLVISVPDVNVSNNILEIRFYFAGKGTTRIPNRGVYSPLISAISVASDLKHCSSGENSGTLGIIAGVIGVSCLTLVAMGMFWWKCYLPRKWVKQQDQNLPTGTFSLKQIRAATDNFDPANKIGEGGFGPVYKGLLRDGTVIAVKQLSSISRQGNREFLNEIGMISCLQHPNLVKLHGFCVEGDQLLVIYEYLENNSLARALFDHKQNQLKLDWSARLKICTGIAKGLAFLHEESRLKIVHRDIKATNILLDRDLNPKISDFGLARLTEEEKSHVSTRVAGTVIFS